MRTITVDHVEIFIKPLGGNFGPCPRCGGSDVSLLATTNEWKYRCEARDCRIRFNRAGEVLGG